MSTPLQEKPPLLAGSAAGGFGERWTARVREAGGSPAKNVGGFLVAWALFFLILSGTIPLPEVVGHGADAIELTPGGRAALAIMVLVVVLWITEAVPVGITGLMIPTLLVMTGAIERLPQAASGFVTPVVFLCLGAFLFAAILQSAGLDRRLALNLLAKMRAKEAGGIIWGFFGVNLVLSLVIPAANARAATLLPVMNGIVKLFGDSEREQGAKKAIVIQSMVYGSMISGMCILTAHLPNLVLVGLFSKELGLSISYIQWFTLQWPYLGMFVLTQWWVRHYFRTGGVQVRGGAGEIERQAKEMAPARQQDWLIVAVFALVGVLWMTESWHGINSWQSMMIGIMIMFMPGLLSFQWKFLQERTIWGTWLLLAGALSLAAAMSSTGLASYLAEALHPVTAGQPWWVIVLVLMVGTHIMRIGMLSNVAAVTMLAPILLALALRLDLHPVSFTMLVADTDTFAYLLPTQITAAVIAYSTGTFSMMDYLKVGWVAVLIAIAYGLLVLAPWYAFMGIPVWDPTAPWPFGAVGA